ncbi:YciI family protein [Spirosoma koreense]
MKNYLILVREPDGRTVVPPVEDNRQHQLAVKAWIDDLAAKGHWGSGNALTLSGKVIRPGASGPQVSDGLYQVNGLEIVGGYLLIKARDLDEAVALAQTCPMLDTDGFLEIRETM